MMAFFHIAIFGLLFGYYFSLLLYFIAAFISHWHYITNIILFSSSAFRLRHYYAITIIFIYFLHYHFRYFIVFIFADYADITPTLPPFCFRRHFIIAAIFTLRRLLLLSFIIDGHIISWRYAFAIFGFITFFAPLAITLLTFAYWHFLRWCRCRFAMLPPMMPRAPPMMARLLLFLLMMLPMPLYYFADAIVDDIFTPTWCWRRYLFHYCLMIDITYMLMMPHWWLLLLLMLLAFSIDAIDIIFSLFDAAILLFSSIAARVDDDYWCYICHIGVIFIYIIVTCRCHFSAAMPRRYCLFLRYADYWLLFAAYFRRFMPRFSFFRCRFSLFSLIFTPRHYHLRYHLLSMPLAGYLRHWCFHCLAFFDVADTLLRCRHYLRYHDMLFFSLLMMPETLRHYAIAYYV